LTAQWTDLRANPPKGGDAKLQGLDLRDLRECGSQLPVCDGDPRRIERGCDRREADHTEGLTAIRPP